MRALLDFKRRRALAFEDAARTYGGVAALHCLGFKLYLVTGAEPVRHVMVTNADNYVKSPGGRRAQAFFGQSLQTTPGAAAKQRRQMLATILQRDRVRPVPLTEEAANTVYRLLPLRCQQSSLCSLRRVLKDPVYFSSS